MYQYKHIHTFIQYTHTHIFTYSYKQQTHIYTYMHAPPIYIYTDSLTGIHTAIHIRMYTHIHTHTHANKYTCSPSMKKEHEDLVLQLYSLKSFKEFSPSDGKISEK